MTSSSNPPGAATNEPAVPRRSLLRRKSSAAADWMKASFNSAKSSTTNKINERLTMEGLLKQAHISLKHFLNPKFLSIEEKLFQRLLRNAQGIAFITELKGGFLFGVKGGSGIIVARTDSNAHINIPTVAKIQHKNIPMEWSAPCAVGTGGLSFGFQAGISKIDHIIILPTEDHIDVFMGKGQLQLGGSASAVLAKYGRNATVGMTAGPGINSPANVAPIISYSFGVKGLFGGFSLDMEILKPRKKCNEMFYESNITTEDILRGKHSFKMENEDYKGIVELLNTYVSKPILGVFPNFAPIETVDNGNVNGNGNEEKDDKYVDMELEVEENNNVINSESLQEVGELVR